MGKNRIMIYGPKTDGTYVVEFRTADGEALAISVPVVVHSPSEDRRQSECPPTIASTLPRPSATRLRTD
jgi:hypothetical protein